MANPNKQLSLEDISNLLAAQVKDELKKLIGTRLEDLNPRTLKKIEEKLDDIDGKVEDISAQAGDIDTAVSNIQDLTSDIEQIAEDIRHMIPQEE